MNKTKNALFSVTDKTGVARFAKALSDVGYTLYASSGTEKILREAATEVRSVGELHGHPEAFSGRMKTLSFEIMSSILFDRERDAKEAEKLGIKDISLVVCNLYSFEEMRDRGLSLSELIEHIDIGGPTLIRAAAKNYRHVGVVVSPKDYESVLSELIGQNGTLSERTRERLMTTAFQLVERYDRAIASYFASQFSHHASLSVHPPASTPNQGPVSSPASIRKATPPFSSSVSPFPSLEKSEPAIVTPTPESVDLRESGLHSSFSILAQHTFKKKLTLRYGENPHQKAAIFTNPDQGAFGSLKLHGGKELSYNNLLDLSAALDAISDLDGVACSIIKHGNPAGLAKSSSAETALKLAWQGDPISAFGSVIAFNTIVDESDLKFLQLGAAEKENRKFVEVVAAHAFTREARNYLSLSPNLRVVEVDSTMKDKTEYRLMKGALLMQDADEDLYSTVEAWDGREIEPVDVELLDFSMVAVRAVRSNAIAIARRKIKLHSASIDAAQDSEKEEGSLQLIGMGAGQPNRINSSKLAIEAAITLLQAEAKQLGLSKEEHVFSELSRAYVASDAFFPFPDAALLLAEKGVRHIFQPGGSIRDKEVFQACEKHGVKMFKTGLRHFKHG